MMSMRKVLFLFVILLYSISNAQTLKKGYRGSADLGFCKYISQMDPSNVELSTTHGYQFNPYFFLGAGMGFDFTGEATYGDVGGRPYNKRDSKVDIPMYFCARANFLKTKLSPFIDARFGSHVSDKAEQYVDIELGARYSLSDNMGLSFSIGVQERIVTVDQYKSEIGNKYNGYKTTYYYTDRTGETFHGLIFKFGVDFQ